jgi:dolichol-phosphate mannosyltransferase
MSTAPALSVIVFACNEQENVVPVMHELLSWLDAHEPSSEIVFVDDGSTDDTFALASGVLSGGRHQLTRHEANRGIGAAIKTGVRRARAEWVTFMPADGQIEPEAIGTLRQQALRDRADIVFSVYEDRDDGWHRTLMSWGVRALIGVVHGVDLQSEGPYLFCRNHFDADKLPSDSFFLNFEFPIRSLLAGAKSTLVTIRCRPRRAGYSKSARTRVVVRVARELVDLRVRRTREWFADKAR